MEKSATVSCKKLKLVTSGGSIECVNEVLIPGLPDDLALLCLAKVSHGFLGVLQCMCKRWREAIRSKDYAVYKSRVGRCGDWLFVFMEEKDKSRHWKAYDPEADKWHPIPPMPKANCDLDIGFSCVTVCNRLLVIGGVLHGDDFRAPSRVTSQVLSFDPYRQEWSQVASMSTPRAFSACSVISDKVYVGGGCGGPPRCTYNPLSSAEVYDPVNNRWEELPTMSNPMNKCFGYSYDGKFHIVDKWFININIFDPVDGQWCYQFGGSRTELLLKYHNLPAYPWSIVFDDLVCRMRNKLYIIGRSIHVDKMYDYRLGRQVYPSTMRFCDLSVTPLQLRETIIHGNNCEKLAFVSLEDRVRTQESDV